MLKARAAMVIERLDLSFLDKVVLLETPKGFVLFNINPEILNAPKVIFLVDYIKLKGKVKLFDDDYVARELVWGLKNVLSGFLYQERDNITPEYLLPVSEGLKESIIKFGFSFPTEAINVVFIRNAGSLHRCHVLLYHVGKDVREACDKLVPGIGEMIEDDMLYAKVMAKILIPELKEDWEFSMSFAPDMVLKLQRVLKSYADRCARQQKLQMTGKRCHTDVVDAAETSRGAEDSPYASSEVYKKARSVEA
ncbi:unnamed protein product [Urochloa decumbens]|uniref:Uncharacterized protein n=1 Tax=Urochloa decumbens TaxID=240449 RepID=A0ABC8YT57_9POAL